MGQNYLRSLFAVGFQGMLILVCVAIYAVLIQGIATGGDPIGAIWGIVGYTVLLCFICFIKQYFPRAQLHEIPKMDHAELVMMYPQDFYRRIMEFLTHTSAAQNKRS